MIRSPHTGPGKAERGATLVEFALIAMIFFSLLILAIEFGRLLYTWNALVDASRRGARTAAIVAVGNRSAVVADMQLIVPALNDENVAIAYSADGLTFSPACTVGSCQFVRVSITSFSHRMIFLPAAAAPAIERLTLENDSFSTTLPVEALGAG